MTVFARAICVSCDERKVVGMNETIRLLKRFRLSVTGKAIGPECSLVHVLVTGLAFLGKTEKTPLFRRDKRGI